MNYQKTYLEKSVYSTGSDFSFLYALLIQLENILNDETCTKPTRMEHVDSGR